MKLQFLSKERIIIYSGLILVCIFSGLAIRVTDNNVHNEETKQLQLIGTEQNLSSTIKQFINLKAKYQNYSSQGVDVKSLDSQITIIRNYIYTKNNLSQAKLLISQTDKSLDDLLSAKQEQDRLAQAKLAEAQKQAEEAKAKAALLKGILTGTITSKGKPVSKASVSINLGKTVIGTIKSNSSGQFSLSVAANKYTVIVSASGYNTFYLYNIVVQAKQTKQVNIALTPVSSRGSTGNSSTSPRIASPQKMRDYLNQIRLTAGKPALQGNTLLDQAALAKVKDMYYKDYFAHCQPLTNICDWDFIKQSGFVGIPGCIVLTSVASFEEDAIDAWMDSQGHKNCLMQVSNFPSNYTEVIGFAGYGWLYAGFVGFVKN